MRLDFHGFLESDCAQGAKADYRITHSQQSSSNGWRIISNIQQISTQKIWKLLRTQALFSVFTSDFTSGLTSGFTSAFASSLLSFIPSFNARMPSPKPLPSSGSFLGPNTSKAIKKITSRCIGWKRPSNIRTSPQAQLYALTLLKPDYSVNVTLALP